MKKDVGMTTAPKSKVGMKNRNGINLCSVYPANNPYIYVHYLKLPDVYVGIVGWIYRTKIDPISILHTYPCFFTFWSSGHPYIFFHFTEMFFPLLVPGLFSLNSSFLVLKLGR